MTMAVTETQRQNNPALEQQEADRPETTLPDDLPDGNDLTRGLFAAYPEGEALEFVKKDRIIHLLPWSARNGGVAGFIQDLETYRPRPAEFTGSDVSRLLKEQAPRMVSLLSTPAWVFTEREQGAKVSWHARCRFAERIEPLADPAPRIREAFEQGVPVGIEGRGKGVYYPPDDLVIAYVGTIDDPVVTTVYRPDEGGSLATGHLKNCPSCGQLYNAPTGTDCSCCGGSICPWCGESI